MSERTARVAAAAGLALFAALGVLATRRPTAVAVAALIVVAAVGIVAAWRNLTGWWLATVLAVAAAGLVVLGHGQSSNLAWMGFCVVAGWVAIGSPAPVTASTSAALGAVLASEWLQQTSEPGWAAWFLGTAFTVMACAFGRRLRLTIDQLRAAQDQLAERSRSEERNRIAGEVHDVIGHALTVSLLHISSARLAFDESPHEAARALGEAERLTRQSLEEVRATVGLMRTEDQTATTPLPGARQVPELVESFRRAGTRVDLVITGDLDSLPPTRGLALYRILQEALTNAVRHAAGQPVAVLLETHEGGVTLTVRNERPVQASSDPGTGLLGMRERAESVGGKLRAGAASEAGRPCWRVEAVLPR